MGQNVTSASLRVTLSGTVTDTFDLWTPESSFTINQDSSLTNGEGSGEINFVWSKSGSMGASGANTIDLNGTEVDIYGNTLALDSLKVLIVRNTSTTGSSLTITTNGIGFVSAGASVPLGAGDPFVTSNLTTGWAITAGSADTITITNDNAGNSASYEIMVAGVKIDASSSSSSFSSATSDSSSSLSSTSLSSDSSSSDSSSSESSSSESSSSP